MAEFLSSWAGGITVSVIIATILEMILQEGKNRKYIKTVIGIYILFVILSPIITKVSGEEIDFQNIFEGYEISTKEVASIDTESSIKEVYLSNLKTDMTSKLNQRGYEVLEIELEIGETIDKIDLSLKRLDTSKIKKVEIGEQEEESLTSSEINEIKEYLSTTYDIQKKNISVGG